MAGTDFEALFASLRGKSDAATAGDLRGVLSPAAIAEVAQVPPRPPVADSGWWPLAASMAAAVCWHRCLADIRGAEAQFVEAAERTTALLALAAVDGVLLGIRPLAALGGTVLAERAASGEYEDSTIDYAITLLDAAVSLTPAAHPGRPTLMSDLSTVLQRRYQREMRAADIDRAVAAARQCTATTTTDGADEESAPVFWFVLGCALRLRYQRNEMSADLEEAISADRQALALTPEGAWAARAKRLTNLLAGLTMRHNALREHHSLEEAIDVARAAVNAAQRLADTPDHRRLLVTCVVNLHKLLDVRARDSKELADFDELVDAATLMARLDGSAAPLTHASTSFRMRAEVTDRPADFDGAVEYARLAQTRSGEVADGGEALSLLGIALDLRFRRLGQLADIEEAVALRTRAVASCPSESSNLPVYLSNLGLSLMEMQRYTGRLHEIDDAVGHLRQAVAALSRAPGIERAKWRFLSNLALGLERRFRHRGDLTDLDEAISLMTEALALAGDDSPDASVIGQNLGSMLNYRYAETARAPDLDRAIELLTNHDLATDTRPNSALLYWSSVGKAKLAKAQLTRQPQDIAQSIEALGRALEVTPPEDPERAVALHDLGSSYLVRSVVNGLGEDADTAVRLLDEAVRSTPEGHTERAVHLENLGRALRHRARIRADTGDAGRACAVWQEAATEATASTTTRLQAAQSWAHLAASMNDIDSANRGYALAVALLSRVAWPGLGRGEQERLLGMRNSVAADAAAAAVSVGDHAAALGRLEAGRGVLWSQIMDRRADLKALQRAAPQLAERLETVHVALAQTHGTVGL